MKKAHLIIAGVVGIGGYYWYTHRSASGPAKTPQTSILGILKDAGTSLSGTLKGFLGGGTPTKTSGAAGSGWDLNAVAKAVGLGGDSSGLLDTNTNAYSGGVNLSVGGRQPETGDVVSTQPSSLDDLVAGDSFTLS